MQNQQPLTPEEIKAIKDKGKVKEKQVTDGKIIKK